MQGYFIKNTAIISKHKVLDAAIKEVPENFYETPILDPNGECLRLVNDNGNVRIEVVEPYLPSNEELETQRIHSDIAMLQSILNSSDYQVVKCAERGLDFAQKYPELKEQREEARAKISELRAML
ncbi:MAG: hypothetical protein ACRC9X_05265 [Bacteroidales bacterium]